MNSQIVIVYEIITNTFRIQVKYNFILCHRPQTWTNKVKDWPWRREEYTCCSFSFWLTLSSLVEPAKEKKVHTVKCHAVPLNHDLMRIMTRWNIGNQRRKVSPADCLQQHSNNRKIMNMIPPAVPTTNSTGNEELSGLDTSVFTPLINNNYWLMRPYNIRLPQSII